MMTRLRKPLVMKVMRSCQEHYISNSNHIKKHLIYQSAINRICLQQALIIWMILSIGPVKKNIKVISVHFINASSNTATTTFLHNTNRHLNIDFDKQNTPLSQCQSKLLSIFSSTLNHSNNCNRSL